MQSLHSRTHSSESGFTLVEMMIVVAVVGLIAAFAVPSYGRYQSQESAKRNINVVAGMLRDARDSALRSGIPHIVIFDPDGAPTGTVGMIVRDLNRNWIEDAGEQTRFVRFNSFSGTSTSPYNAPSTNAPFFGESPPINLPEEDNDGADFLNDVDNGTHFPTDPDTGKPAIGFNAQGIPIDLTNPTAIGAGTGGFYFTDNNLGVYGAVVGGLGEIRVRTLDPGTRTWR